MYADDVSRSLDSPVHLKINVHGALANAVANNVCVRWGECCLFL